MIKGRLNFEIKKKREQKNLSQVEACQELGVSYVTYSKLENNPKYKPSYKTINAIAKWLEVSAEEVRSWL